MNIKDIWDLETNNKANVELISDDIYKDIILGIQKNLKEFQAVYEKTFHIATYTNKNFTAEDFQQIFENLKERLTKDEYIFDSEKEFTNKNTYIKFTIYLLEKTDAQYQMMEYATKNITSMNLSEKINSGNESKFTTVMIYVAFYSFLFTLVVLFLLNLQKAAIIVMLVALVVCGIMCVSDYKGFKSKNCKAEEFEKVLKNQERIFLTKDVNKKEVLEKYHSYKYDSYWKNFL